MQQQFSTTQNAGTQPVVYDNLQMRRVPTWPYINEVTTGNVGNQYYSSMSMYPNGQPAGFFPRSSSLNSMTEIMVPMTGIVQGNTEAMQPGLVALPTVGAAHYMPAQFLSRQSSQDVQAPCTPTSGYQQQPIQPWHYNHYTNTPPATLQYPPPQQAMMYNVGGESEATSKARKPPLKRKPIDYTVDASPFHGSNIRHHIMLNKQVQWPRFIYETRRAKSLNAQQSGDKSTGGKINSSSSEQISSMLCMPTHMPTHRPRSPKKRPWKGEKKVRFIPKKPAKRRRNRSVEQVLKSCAKKLRESSLEEVSEKRPKRSAPMPLTKETLVKEKTKVPTSLGYSQTPPESSDEISEDVETETVAQPVDSKMAPKNPNGRAANGFELVPESRNLVCTKPVLAPTLPQNYRPETVLEKSPKLFAFPPKLPPVVTQQVNKADIRLDNKKMPTTLTEEQDVLSVKCGLVSPKELTPTNHQPSSEITTPGSSCRLAGMKPPIPYTPHTEKIIKPKPKPTLKPTVPPLKRHDWSPAPLVSEFNLPLIIERPVKDDPWTMVRRRKHGGIPEIRMNTPSPKQIQTPTPSKQVLHPKEQKKSRRKRKRKKIRAPESSKVETNPPTTAPEEPLVAQAPSKRESRCDFVMDCLQRTFPFAWRKEKTN